MKAFFIGFILAHKFAPFGFAIRRTVLVVNPGTQVYPDKSLGFGIANLLGRRRSRDFRLCARFALVGSFRG